MECMRSIKIFEETVLGSVHKMSLSGGYTTGTLRVVKSSRHGHWTEPQNHRRRRRKRI